MRAHTNYWITLSILVFTVFTQAQPIDADNPASPMFDAVLHDYDRQIDNIIEASEGPVPDIPHHINFNNASADVAALLDDGDRGSYAQKLDQYIHEAEIATHSLHSELTHAVHHLSEFLKSYRAQSLQRNHQISQYRASAEAQIQKAVDYANNLKGDVSLFQPHLEDAKARVEEYAAARDELLATHGEKGIDTSAPYQLSTLESYLHQAASVKDQTESAIAARTQMINQVSDWITSSSETLSDWVQHETASLHAFVKSSHRYLSKSTKELKASQKKYKNAVRLMHNYKIIQKRFNLQSDALVMEKKLRKVKLGHEQLNSALRVAKRRSHEFERKEHTIQDKIELIDHQLEAFKGVDLQLETPPTFWDVYTAGSDSLLPEEIAQAAAGMDVVLQSNIDASSAAAAQGLFDPNGDPETSFDRVSRNMNAGSAIAMGGAAAATVTSGTPNQSPNYYPPTPPQFPPVPNLELQG